MTSRTDERRAASSAPRGTSKGTCASVRVRLARTMLCAMVLSGTRKARAISPVDRPPNRRSVSATWASVESTGWQEMNIRRRRSSPTSSSIALAMSGTAISLYANSRPNSSSFRSCSALRRKRSIARCLAVAMSQAPGLTGTPDFGHCSNAATRASWARSSATPTSRTMRVSPAISLADSILQTASIARCVSPAMVTANHHTIFNPAVQAEPVWGHASRHALLPRLRPQILKPCRGLSHVSGEIRKLLHLAHLDDTVIITGTACCPLNGFVSRLHLNHPVTAKRLLGFGEGSVDNLRFAAGEADPRPHGRRLQPVEREQHPRLLQGLVVLHHCRHGFGARHRPGFGLLVIFRDHQHHESHRCSPLQ